MQDAENIRRSTALHRYRGHDWEHDPRPLAECLAEWERQLNGGRVIGARAAGARALRVPPTTYAGWRVGRVPQHEAMVRRLMVLSRAKIAKKAVEVIAGTGIPTGAIRRFHEAGYSPSQIILEYPSLTLRDVEAALAYEMVRLSAGGGS